MATATPALTFNNTLSDQFANSYCDLNYATSYFTNHYISTYITTWSNLSPLAQQLLLMSACRVIETARFTNYVRPTDYAFFYDYITGMVRQLAERMEPIRYMNYQALQFPRNVDIDLATGQTFIPDPILMAQCEQAMYLTTYDGAALASRIQGISSEAVSLGKGQLHSATTYLGEGSSFAPMAMELCRPFFLRGGQRMRRA